MRFARLSGGLFAFQGYGKDSSQITANVDLKFAVLWRQHDLLYQRADLLGRHYAMSLGIVVERRIEMLDLDPVMLRHVGM
ncbi:hypothetical protein AB4037_33895 [Labrys sp. KB_33_2]|uniref:hypothetical protein n=1 Tax=unclassified Labrys (in: a-proteobacteria) TaxID=2688601 RepID=UPI003EBD61F1